MIFGEPRRGGKRHCLSFISPFPSPCRSRKDLLISLFVSKTSAAKDEYSILFLYFVAITADCKVSGIITRSLPTQCRREGFFSLREISSHSLSRFADKIAGISR